MKSKLHDDEIPYELPRYTKFKPWFRCVDKHPHRFGYYLVYVKRMDVEEVRFICVREWQDDRWESYGMRDIVTHWKEIDMPKAPKD